MLSEPDAAQWEAYERGKDEIERTAESAEEYDERLAWLVAELGL